MSTFLLERGRVIDDRPFHIVTLLRKLRETGEKPEAFTKICTALSELGLDEEKQERIWSVLEGIDHLIAGNDAPAAECFGLDPQQFHDALTVRTVKAGNVDTVNKPRIGAELKAAQEGLVRALYAWLFEWLVAEVNHALGAADSEGPCISLIDIFGFESFERNTLAQFLINWANEQLQRQLSKDVLERQAEVYMDEGIEMEKPTPQPSCLELIANKPGRKTQTGIACLLDDETRRLGLGLGGTDETFAGNINLECHKLHGYVRSPYTKPNEFVVAHYARQVKYDTRGFLAANSERVDDKLLNCLTSGGEFMQTLVLPRTAGRNSFASVVTSFRKSLDELNNLLTNTRVHYIHCIKPNNEAKAWVFRRDLVSVQVGAAGITQIARFARECGPYRVPHAEMAPYYLVLDTPPNDMQEVVKALSDIAGDPKGVQVGRSFVFFNAAALSKIDAALERKVEVLTRLQSAARRFTTQRSFIERRDAMRRKKEEERRAAEALRKQLEAAAAKERELTFAVIVTDFSRSRSRSCPSCEAGRARKVIIDGQGEGGTERKWRCRTAVCGHDAYDRQHRHDRRHRDAWIARLVDLVHYGGGERRRPLPHAASADARTARHRARCQAGLCFSAGARDHQQRRGLRDNCHRWLASRTYCLLAPRAGDGRRAGQDYNGAHIWSARAHGTKLDPEDLVRALAVPGCARVGLLGAAGSPAGAAVRPSHEVHLRPGGEDDNGAPGLARRAALEPLHGVSHALAYRVP